MLSSRPPDVTKIGDIACRVNFSLKFTIFFCKTKKKLHFEKVQNKVAIHL
jgi:hypothetical protein